jgi:hypothetical protein
MKRVDDTNWRVWGPLIFASLLFVVFGGKKNGIMTAAVTYGYGTRDEIQASEPDFIFHSPSDLAAFLETKGPPSGCTGSPINPAPGDLLVTCIN